MYIRMPIIVGLLSFQKIIAVFFVGTFRKVAIQTVAPSEIQINGSPNANSSPQTPNPYFLLDLNWVEEGKF